MLFVQAADIVAYFDPSSSGVRFPLTACLDATDDPTAASERSALAAAGAPL